MSRTEWIKILVIGVILTALIGGGALLLMDADRKKRIQAAEEKWQRVQEEAATQNIFTDIDAYLAANSGEAPRLLDDFPFVSQLLSTEAAAFDINNSKGLSKVPKIGPEMTHQEIMQELRNSLTTSLPPDANNEAVYQAILEALQPFEKDLEQWKAHVFASNGLGKNYCKQEKFILPYEIFSYPAQILLLRSYCNWSLGSTDTSDIERVIRANDLIYEHAPSLMGLTIAIAVDIQANAFLVTSIKNTNISTEHASNLLQYFQIIQTSSQFSKALQIEYVFQLDFISSILARSPHPFAELDDDFRNTPLHVLHEIRSDTADIFKCYYLDSTSPNYIDNLLSFYSTFEKKIMSAEIEDPSKGAILSTAIGFDFGYKGSLKSEITLQSQKLQAACIIYHREHGKYPSSLDDLTQKYIQKVPLIPIVGKPYQYSPPTDPGGLPMISATIPVTDGEDITYPNQYTKRR